jgi:hypothetical protein
MQLQFFELLMMGGVLPETCWAIKKHRNNKFYYTAAPCWFFLWDLYYDARIHEHPAGYIYERKTVARTENSVLVTTALISTRQEGGLRVLRSVLRNSTAQFHYFGHRNTVGTVVITCNLKMTNALRVQFTHWDLFIGSRKHVYRGYN